MSYCPYTCLISAYYVVDNSEFYLLNMSSKLAFKCFEQSLVKLDCFVETKYWIQILAMA